MTARTPPRTTNASAPPTPRRRSGRPRLGRRPAPVAVRGRARPARSGRRAADRASRGVSGDAARRARAESSSRPSYRPCRVRGHRGGGPEPHARLPGVSHPSLGPAAARPAPPACRPPPRASHAARERLAARALEVAIDRDPTLRDALRRDRAAPAAARHRRRSIDRVVDALAAGDPEPRPRLRRAVPPIYRRRKVPMDDLIDLVRGHPRGDRRDPARRRDGARRRRGRRDDRPLHAGTAGSPATPASGTASSRRSTRAPER